MGAPFESTLVRKGVSWVSFLKAGLTRAWAHGDLIATWSTVGGDSAILGTRARVERVALDGANEIVAMCRHERESINSDSGSPLAVAVTRWVGMDRHVSSLGVRSTPSACDPGGILRSRPMLPDLAKVSEDELIELNRRIVERLQLLRSAKSLAQLAKFSAGMVVQFDADDGRTLEAGPSHV